MSGLETYWCVDTHKYAVAVTNSCIAVHQDAVPSYAACEQVVWCVGLYCGSASRSGGRVVETGRRVSEQKAREATETGNNSTNNVTVSPSVGQLQILSARACFQLLSNLPYSRSRIAVPILKTAAPNRS